MIRGSKFLTQKANHMPDDGDLFLKDGAPVRFCFHRSVTQGRGQITRDVERHGGQIIPDERTAHVLLVDEQEDIEFLRRRYYSSTERYRLSIYVEPRGFVQACLRSGTYQHVGPVKQGMPGRAPGQGARRRIAFTEEDRDHLAYYLATRCPLRDGRMGNAPYKDLERLAQTEDPSWAWARRHSWHSWREHYKTRPELMDPRIAHYVRRLHNVGHHFGHDPRSHEYRNLQRQLAEEDESDESDEEEAWDGIEGQEERGHDTPVPRRQQRAARDYLARHDEEVLIIDDDDDEDEDEDEEEIVPQRVKRHRATPEVRRRDVRGAQAKKARISTDERQTPDTEASRDRSPPVNMERQKSEEIEGSDLFGDRDYDHFEDQDVEYPVPFSPRASPGPPPSTQATLIASPRRTEKEPTFTQVTRPARRAVEERGRMPPPTIPPSSQRTLVADEEPAAAIRIPVYGPSAAGPSASRGRRADAPSLNTRARSRSAEPPSQPAQRKDKRKEEIKEEQMEVEIGGTSVNNGISAVEDEKAVEGLLEGIEDDEDGDEEESDSDYGDLPPFQEVKDADSEPSDSDDKETHGSLVRGARGSEEEEEEEDVERIERMARGKLVAAPVAVRFSPRRTRSATQQAKETTSRVTRARARGRQS